MLIKTLLIILICSTSLVYGQNANTVVNAANKTVNAANRAANTAWNAAPMPTPTPVPDNTTIRGKAFFEDDGKPLRRSVIIFFKNGNGGEPQTLTDDNGNFEIKNIPAGTYFPMSLSVGVVNFFASIDFEKIGSSESEKETFKSAMQGFQQIVADGKTDLEVKIPLKRGGAISGTVNYSDGSPAAGRLIQILRKVNGKLQPVVSNIACLALSGSGSGICNQTDERGQYRFLGLPAGDYFIRVNEPAIHSKNLSILGGGDRAMSLMFGIGALLNTYYPNTIEANQAKPIKTELGKEQKDVNITIPDWKLYEIAGKVISEKDGKPVRSKIYIQTNDLTANITPPNYEQYRSSVDTDDNGNWSFNEIPKGNYTLLVEPFNSDSFRYTGNFAVATNSVADAANMVANTAKSGKYSNRHPSPSPTPNLPAGFSKMSKTLTVENSNLANVEIKLNMSAWIFGTIVVPPRTDSEGRLKIMAFDENDTLLETNYVYLTALRSDLSKPEINTFELKGLPKGKIKLKFETLGENLDVQSATVNGIDLLKNFVELKEGQILRTVKVILEKKKQ